MRETNQKRRVDRQNPLKINAFESHSLDYPFHYHPDHFELTIVRGGKGLRIVGDNAEEFQETDIVLVGPGLPHCWISDRTETDNKYNFQVIVVHFNRHIFGNELLARDEFKHIGDMMDLAARGIAMAEVIPEEMTNLFYQFTLEPDAESYIGMMRILNLMARSGNYKTLGSTSYSFKGRSEELIRFESVFNYVQTNYLSRIKISEVASLAGMNDSAFSHYFKKRTRYSFTDFINLLRLDHAARLIQENNRNIADICYASGFNNLSNFNRMFKKWKGLTPLKYRKIRLMVEAID